MNNEKCWSAPSGVAQIVLVRKPFMLAKPEPATPKK